MAKPTVEEMWRRILLGPGFAGSDHADDAIAAARDLLEQTGNDGGDPWMREAAGVTILERR